MDFRFSPDQLQFRETVRAMLARECSAERVRALWESESGRSRELWAKLAEMGMLGILVPEAHGGLGLAEIDLVLLLEETGRVALAEPIVESAAVAARLLAECDDQAVAARWLPAIAEGRAIVGVGVPAAGPFVADAHVADLLLLAHESEIHAVAPDDVTIEPQPANDRSRRLFRVSWKPSQATHIAGGARARLLLDRALDRGALGVAAQQLGVARQLVDLAVAYACQREQFGQPIGSFQAIKHMLASVQVRIEFARPVVARAAFSVAVDDAERALHVSHAKVAASEAALLAAKTALQVHGAIGYTWEIDLHMWMKRAWTLDLAWGARLWHRRRVAARVLDGSMPAPSFGFQACT